ncbi:MAG: T9SS type A sorting domain-containing protein, partial [Cyclobacteriaceae bacterium]
SQSGELANEIVDASNNSYATVAAALAAGGTIQNLPSGTVSGTSTVSLATTLISPGAGNLHSGSLTTFETLNISGADLTLGSDLAVSTTLDVSASRNAVLDDYNLLLSGTVTGAGEIAGSSTSGVYFSGTGALGTLTFASGARELERLDLNRTSTGTVTLGADLDVALLSLTNGILNTGANNLNFTGITALQGNDNSFVNGNFVNQVTGTPAGNTIVFPVGVTEYRPISIEGLDQSGTTSYTGTVTESTPPSSTAFLGNSLLDKLSLTRYWTVTPSAFNVTGADLITLTYGDAENVSDQGNLRVAQFQTSDWYNLGGSGASPISSGGTPPNAIALTLGDFALGDEPGGTNFTEIATVFVNASTGDDANDGASSGTPKLTLTAGFNLVQSAGTINIAAGSYGETIDINQPVTIAGTGSPTTTSVTLNADITLTDFSSTTVNVGSLGIVQDGIDLAAIAGTVNVVAGTFNETLAVGKALTLNGANVGIAGNSASRGAETIVEPASAVIGLTISSSDVTINGFQFGTDNSTSNNTTAISSVANTNLSISNNVIFANGTGMSIAGASSGTIGVLNNSVEMLNLVDPLNITVPSFGIVAQSITGTADADFTDNDLQTASYGIFGYELTASPTVTINGGSFVGCTKGIEINNTDGSNFSPSTVDILNVVMSSFADPVLPQPDTQAGIYAYVTGNATATDDLVVSINNADISGIGSGGTDYAAIYIADFQATGPFDGTDDDGIAVTATVSNSNIHDNSNRGIYSRGRNAVTTVTQTTLSGNGSVAGAGGVVFAFGTLNISNSVIVNPATGTVDALLAQNNGTITATNNSFDDNGNGDLADVQSGGTIDMSRNWLGSINETTISALVDLAGVDFTPWIENGTDTDGATAGFQPDLDTLYVGTTGTQTGSTGRWQEGHDLVDALGTVVLANADYAETVTVTKSVTFEPTSGAGDTSLDNLVMNGTGVTMTLEGNLLIDNAVTLTDGNIDVNSGELRLGVSATDITEIAASQIAGRVTMDPRLVGTGALSILGVSISANPADNLGNVSITRNTGPGAVIVGGPNSSIAANWDITVDTEPVNAGRDVTFTWLSDFDNGLAMTGVNVFRNGGSGWVEVAGPFDASLSDPRTVTANAVTQFSIWSMAPASAPLPVELVSFEGQNSNGKVELRWSTMTELNADYFEIQKSFDAASFVAAHQVDAAGNSNVVRKYSWTDPASLRTTSFYRLKIVDFDGSHEYSSIVGVDPMISTEITVFPNPTTDYVHVGHAGELTYSLYDQQGRRIQSGIVETGRVDLSQLKSGVYFLQLGKQERKKLIKK